jgi:hypothetical protein
VEIISVNYSYVYFDWIGKKVKMLFMYQSKFHTLNSGLILKRRNKELEQQFFEAVKHLKQDESLKFMSFNYSNFSFLITPKPKRFYPDIFVSNPEDCETKYDELKFLVNNNYYVKNQLNYKIPICKWYNAIERKDLEDLKLCLKWTRRK